MSTSTPPDPSTVLERLERLERSNAVWKNITRVGLLLAAGVCVYLFWSGRNARFALVEAEAVVVNDPNGQKGALLGMQDGSGFLDVYGKDGGTVQLRTTNGTPGVVIFDANKKPRAQLILARGASSLDILDDNQVPRVSVAFDGKEPKVVVYNELRQPEAGIGSTGKSWGFVVLDRDKHRRAEMVMGADGRAAVNVINPGDKPAEKPPAGQE